MDSETFECRVLVCGGRDYEKSHYVNTALELVWKYSVGILVIIEGGATGADQFAKEWAEEHEAFGVKHEQYPAKWRENGYYNPTAGFERNALMIAEGKPNLGLWFPGGNGTKDMVSKLKKAGITIARGENMHGIANAIREALAS